VNVCLLYVSKILWKLLLMMRFLAFMGLAAMLGTCKRQEQQPSAHS
jgi:hypothetical protein